MQTACCPTRLLFLSSSSGQRYDLAATHAGQASQRRVVDAVRDLESLVSAMQERIAGLETNMSASIEKNKQLTSQVAELVAANADLERRSVALQGEISVLQGRLEGLASEASAGGDALGTATSGELRTSAVAVSEYIRTVNQSIRMLTLT